jgi:hypothetical protein
MKARGAAVQSGLAAIGLLAAYATWQREPERAPGDVTVLDVSKSDLQKIRYEDGNGKWVVLERRKEGAGSDEEPRVWLHLSATTTPKAPERELPGSDGASRLFDKFAPLSATRSLGVIAGDKLKELGLDAPKKKLEITARGQVHSYWLGTSPFGVTEPYVKDEHDGRVYVLGGGVLSDLDTASIRLIDRGLHTFKPADVDAVTISADGKRRELTATVAENQFAIKLSSKKTSKPDDMAKNWHEKLWRVAPIEVLGKGEQPASGAPQVACKVEYQSHGKPKGFIELARGTAPAAITSSPTPPPAEVFARTERTAGWDKLSAMADDVVKECSKIAAAE